MFDFLRVPCDNFSQVKLIVDLCEKRKATAESCYPLDSLLFPLSVSGKATLIFKLETLEKGNCLNCVDGECLRKCYKVLALVFWCEDMRVDLLGRECAQLTKCAEETNLRDYVTISAADFINRWCI